MLSEFHLIRPYWLLALLPLIAMVWLAFRKHSTASAWNDVCDPHLLPHLIQTKPQHQHRLSLFLLFFSALWMVISLSGPSWSRIHVPTYQAKQPRILLLDMSEAMLEHDIQPNRLSRAKFKLHDLLARRDSAGQFGLIVYTGEPFVASPLTDDSQTIDALLPMLLPNIMPVGGHRLDLALLEAMHLFTQAGFNEGHILVLTPRSPDTKDIAAAKTLYDKGFHISIMPMQHHEKALNPLFAQFAKAGGGQSIHWRDTSDDIDQWLRTSQTNQGFSTNTDNEVSIGRDQGRLLIIPALLLLLPVFRRGWLQRISS